MNRNGSDIGNGIIVKYVDLKIEVILTLKIILAL